MTPIPPIRGHALLFEGLRGFHPDRPWGCQCGQKPEGPYPGAAATKRWHREHKADLRAKAAAR